MNADDLETVEEIPEVRLKGWVRSGPVTAEYTRDLTVADLHALEQPRGTVAPTLKRLHASHHALAKCLASGMKAEQASLVTGYSVQRVSTLLCDRSFKELVAGYRLEAKEIFADLAERMQNMSLDAIEVLQERLHEKPEDFSVGMLLDVIKGFADRTGFGPNQDVRLTVQSNDLIDRPPRETHEEWEKRRLRELNGSGGDH